MAQHTITLDQTAEAGWGYIVAKINASALAKDPGARTVTVDQYITGFLEANGAGHFATYLDDLNAVSRAAYLEADPSVRTSALEAIGVSADPTAVAQAIVTAANS